MFSKLIGTHEIVGSGTGFVVINIQRDVNFKSDEGTPAWKIGSVGVGYDSGKTAKFYCIGGNNGTTDSNASGAFSVTSGGNIDTGTLTIVGGGGYSNQSYGGKPQVIISGGGWRKASAPNAVCNDILMANEGVFIQRRAPGGVKAFISMNPFDCLFKFKPYLHLKRKYILHFHHFVWKFYLVCRKKLRF